MTMRDIGQVVATTCTVLSALPVVVGARRLGQRSRSEKLLWGWLLLALVLNLVETYLGMRGVKNAGFAELNYPVFAVLAGATCWSLVRAPRTRRIVVVAVGLYLLWWGWQVVGRGQAGDFNSYTGPALWLMISVGGAVMIGEALGRNTAHPFRDPRVLVGLALLISYAPQAALEPVSAIIYHEHEQLTLVLWVVRGLLLIAGLLLFTLVFVRTMPRSREERQGQGTPHGVMP